MRLIEMRIITCLAGAALLAGCGSYGNTGAGSNPTGIALTAKDFSFDPGTISATAGQPVTITVRNTGSVQHNLTIAAFSINKDLDAGRSATVTFTPRADGPAVIQFHCEYHEKRGMVGTINVSGASGPAGPGLSPSATASPYHY